MTNVPFPPDGEAPRESNELDLESVKVWQSLASAMVFSAIGKLDEGIVVTDDDLFDIGRATGDDLSGNANGFVPWSDDMIPFECSCGGIFYADTQHQH